MQVVCSQEVTVLPKDPGESLNGMLVCVLKLGNRGMTRFAFVRLEVGNPSVSLLRFPLRSCLTNTA